MFQCSETWKTNTSNDRAVVSKLGYTCTMEYYTLTGNNATGNYTVTLSLVHSVTSAERPLSAARGAPGINDSSRAPRGISEEEGGGTGGLGGLVAELRVSSLGEGHRPRVGRVESPTEGLKKEGISSLPKGRESQFITEMFYHS